ncbi:hypothetical protein KGP36_08300 [Patescibacteria group bacterium]|nr:hypothetical protein [Patescibacteria group bacterium]
MIPVYLYGRTGMASPNATAGTAVTLTVNTLAIAVVGTAQLFGKNIDATYALAVANLMAPLGHWFMAWVSRETGVPMVTATMAKGPTDAA